VDYTSARVKLIQSWRCKTLAVTKRHKTIFVIHSWPKSLKNQISVPSPQLGVNKQMLKWMRAVRNTVFVASGISGIWGEATFNYWRHL